MSQIKSELVSFRELVPEISDTGYLTHAIFYYPAKFIPQVVRYTVNTYTKEGDWIIDPFAGSGTVGLEAYLCRRNAVLLDLNPLLNHIVPLKIYPHKERLNKGRLCQLLEGLEQSAHHFMPSWSNVEYWFPQEMLETLTKYWGFVKSIEQNTYSQIIEATLLKTSRHFSYAEHRIPKLYRSKRKINYIEEILKTKWEDELKDMVFSLSLKTLQDINNFVSLTPNHKNSVEFKGGIDSSNYQVERACDALITSPPYLQAQEYIRTAKMDLFWLGYSEEEIRELARLEIPYRKADRIIQTETLDTIRTKLTRKDLINLLDSYFCHTVNALENAMTTLKPNATACIFVGNPLIDGIKVEIWRILMEYFTKHGYKFEKIYEDKIKTRQLFGARKNKNPEGMKSEYLLILRKS